eukprot:TRINITY_DN6420_c0_g1_i1.p1 TRINITY_DN6420_c0_g1~~TRINITY_DN6420_c0_g1_i1.p1  ORF type:complete len:1668 (-),score=442.20 TRINITY_DN6420_c0_g1_i1:61-5064(-)
MSRSLSFQDAAETSHSETEDEEEDDDDDDDDEMDDEEFERMMQKVSTRTRNSVAAERWVARPEWRPPVRAKTEEQRKAIKAAVGKSFMFRALTADQLETVLDAIDGPHEVEPGEIVIQQGDVVDSVSPGLYIIERGILEVFKAPPSEVSSSLGSKVFTYTEPGQSFGELALLYNSPRAATVRAASQCLLWSIDRGTFNHCVKGAQAALRERREHFLQSVELLQKLEQGEMQKLIDVLHTSVLSAGEHIINQGDVGDEFFLLERGTAYAAVNGQRVKDYQEGDYFGELALLRRQPRAADVVAGSTPTEVLVLDAGSFRRMLGKLTHLLERRAEQYNTAGPAAGRVVSVLLPPCGPGSDGEESDEESEEDDDEIEDEAFERYLSQGPRKSRRAITAEPSMVAAARDWQPPRHPKTVLQREAIGAAMKKSSLFSGLIAEQLETVIDAFAGPHAVAAGVEVIRQGAVVDGEEPGLFIVEKGTLEVFKASAGGAHPGTKVFTYDSFGQSFGELALLYNCPRAATVRSLSDCVLWSINRQTFNHCVIASQASLRERRDAFLQSVELLEGLGANERANLVDVLQQRVYGVGEHIIKQGEMGNTFYMLEEGQAFAAVNGQRVKEYSAGSYFGELALLKEQPRAADVVADAAGTRVLVLDKGSFTRLLGPLADRLEAGAKQYGGGAGKKTPSAPSRPPRKAKVDLCEDGFDSEEDGMHDEEFERQVTRMRSNVSRKAVASERWQYIGNWRPPVHPKTPEQREAIRAAISRSIVFLGLEGSQLEEVVDAFSGPHHIPANVDVIKQGDVVADNSPGIFIVEAGNLDAFKAADGEALPGKKVFTYCLAGQLFGELALMYNCPRAATVRSLSHSVLWCIDRLTFHSCVKESQANSRRRRTRFLQTVELLKHLSSQEQATLVDVLEPRTYNEGDFIVRRGEIGQEFFMLEEGHAYAAVAGQAVAQYAPGSYFGELALMRQETRAADVVAAASPTKVLVLDGASFTRLLGPLSELLEERAKQYAPLAGAASGAASEEDGSRAGAEDPPWRSLLPGAGAPLRTSSSGGRERSRSAGRSAIEASAAGSQPQSNGTQAAESSTQWRGRSPEAPGASCVPRAELAKRLFATYGEHAVEKQRETIQEQQALLEDLTGLLARDAPLEGNGTATSSTSHQAGNNHADSDSQGKRMQERPGVGLAGGACKSLGVSFAAEVDEAAEKRASRSLLPPATQRQGRVDSLDPSTWPDLSLKIEIPEEDDASGMSGSASGYEEYAEVHQKLDRALADLAQLTPRAAEVESLRRSADAERRAREDLQAKLATLESEKSDLQAMLTTTTQQQARMQEDLEAQLRQDREERAAEKAFFEQSLEEGRQMIAALKAAAQNATDAGAAAEAREQQLRRRLLEVESQPVAASADLAAESGAQTRELEKTVESLRRAQQDLQRQHEELKTQFREQSRQLEEHEACLSATSPSKQVSPVREPAAQPDGLALHPPSSPARCTEVPAAAEPLPARPAPAEMRKVPNGSSQAPPAGTASARTASPSSALPSSPSGAARPAVNGTSTNGIKKGNSVASKIATLERRREIALAAASAARRTGSPGGPESPLRSARGCGPQARPPGSRGTTPPRPSARAFGASAARPKPAAAAPSSARPQSYAAAREAAAARLAAGSDNKAAAAPASERR